MTSLILTRHGHVEGIMPERFRGRRDLPLTEKGKRQAELTARRIASTWRPAAIYSSPLSRCVATAAAIGAATGVEVRADARFTDIDYGAWEGRTPEEARAQWPREVELWYRAPHLASPSGGETLQAMLGRVTAGLRELVQRHAEDVVVVVGHSSVNRVMLLHALDLPLSRYWSLGQEPCAINEIDAADESMAVKTLNETWHLHGL
jgi:phosphoserine phosphatase